MQRIKLGWQLTKKSYHVVKKDKSLLIFPILAAVFALLAMVIIWTPYLFTHEELFSESTNEFTSDPLTWVVTVVSAYVSTTLAIYFNVALVGAAQMSLRGEDSKVRDGIKVANQRIGAILAWGALATTIGLILRAIEERFQLVGDIIAGLLGAVWAIASFFAIPIIAVQGLGPFATLKESAHIIKEKWGEGLTGTVAINVISFLITLLLLLVGVGLVVLIGAASLPLAVAVAIFFVALMVVNLAFFSSLTQVFRLAVYQYAKNGQETGEFTSSELSPFHPKKGKI